MSVIPNTLGIAASVDLGRTDVPQIFAGDTPAVVTQDVVIPAAKAQYVPLGPDYAAWAAGQPIIALTAFAHTGTNQRKAVYTAGMFNIDMIAWPNGTTEAQIQKATEQGMVKFRKPLYSDKRTGTEVLGQLAGPATT